MYTLSQFWKFRIKPLWQKPKERKRLHSWLKEWNIVPLQPEVSNGRIAIVRLDDIGDYLLFRPYLVLLKKSETFKNYHITLIGNGAWRSIFEALDQDLVDEVFWINKSEWFTSSEYRSGIASHFYTLPFETVFFPSRTRHFFLEDLLAACFKTSKRICTGNFYSSYRLTEQTNFLIALHYFVIEPEKETTLHELDYNRAWMEAICHTTYPFTPLDPVNAERQSKILLFPGGSAGSKRWPKEYFGKLAVGLKQQFPESKIFVAGSLSEEPIGQSIADMAADNGVELENICGKTSLLELWSIIRSCALVVSNDTSAAHMAALSATPLVVLTNGNKRGRFFPYPVRFTQIKTLFPGKKEPENLYPFSLPIRKIKVEKVLEACQALWIENN